MVGPKYLNNKQYSDNEVVDLHNYSERNHNYSEGKPKKSPVKSTQQFARLPKEVMARRDISFAAKVLLSAMNMRSWGKGLINMSLSVIYNDTNIKPSYAFKVKQELVDAKLMEPVPKSPNTFRLLHPDMRADDEVKVAKVKSKQKSLRLCPECKLEKDPRAFIKRTGLCSKCTHHIDFVSLWKDIQAKHPEFDDAQIHIRVRMQLDKQLCRMKKEDRLAELKKDVLG